MSGVRLGIWDIVQTGGHDGPVIDAAEQLLSRLLETSKIDVMSIEFADPLLSDAKLDGFEERLGGRYLVCEHRFEREALLRLHGSWDGFLASLGHDTRRNVRRYRRKAEEMGLRFRFTEGPPTEAGRKMRYHLGRETHPKPFTERKIDRFDRFVRDRGRSFHADLHSADGEPLAFVTGFVIGDTAYVLYQLNHRAERANSIALVLRGYLIETLIERGIGDLIFPNGCVGSLKIACQRQSLSAVAFVRRSAIARAKAEYLVRKIPAHMASESIRYALDRSPMW